MLTRYLFPHRFKRVGWMLLVVSTALGLLQMTSIYQLPSFLAWLPPLVGDDLTGLGSTVPIRENTDLYAVLFILGGLLTACSRARHEDEYIGKIRLDSLLWALYVYYALLMLAFVLVSGMLFLSVMMYAMFVPLLLFLVRFEFLLRLTTHGLPNEK